MKKLIALLVLLCTFALLLSSCGSKPAIAKPEDTNLEYWLFDKPDKKNMTKWESNYMYVKYLAPGYTEEDVGNYVFYYTRRYPDGFIGIQKIFAIEINDPEATVWGININSTREEVKAALTDAGFYESSYKDNGISSNSTFKYEDKDGTYNFFIIYGDCISINYVTANQVETVIEKLHMEGVVNKILSWISKIGY